MLPWCSKRSLIGTVSTPMRASLWTLAFLAAMALPLSAQQLIPAKLKAASSKPSINKRTSDLAPTVDPTSLRSVEDFVAYLRAQAAKKAQAEIRTDKDRHESDESAVHLPRHQGDRLSGVAKKPLKKLTRAQAKAFGAENDAELEARTEAWESYLYWLRPRVFPGNKLDISAYTRAIAKRDALSGKSNSGGIRANALLPPPPQPNWSTIGPPGYAGGAVSWRVTGLTYDPNDPTHYFAAGSRGGVWESKDSGATWTPITDFLPMLPVSCIAVDFRDSNTIYIGTGEYDSPGPGFGILKGRWDGLKWSFTVLGADIIGNNPIRHITVDPNTSSKVFATAGNKGLLISVDRGLTWKVALGPNTTPAVTGSFSNVVYNSYGDRIYACADGPGGGIFQSLNGGVTWTAMAGAPSPTGRVDIAASPIRSLRGRATLYALLTPEQMVVKGEPTPNTGGAAPEPDDADTGALRWVNCVNFPKTGPGGRNIWDQSTFYNMAIACSTTNDGVLVTDNATPVQHIGFETRDIVIVSLLDLHISLDGGQLWRSGVQRDIGFPYNSGNSGTINYRTTQQVSGYHTDQHALAVNPKNPLEFLAGCDGGAYRITIAPGPEPGGPVNGIHYEIPKPIPNPLPTPPAPPGPPDPHDYALYESVNNIFDWYIVPNPYNTGSSFPKPLGSYTNTPINGDGTIAGGLGIAQFYFIGMHPTDPLTALGGTQDNGTQYSYGAATGWQAVIGGDGGGCGINQFNPGIQFGSLNFKNPSPLDEPFYPVERTGDGWQADVSDVTLYTGDDITSFFSTGEMSRSNPNLFYMSTNYLYQYDERLQDWDKLAKQFTATSTISAIETTPASIKYLYVGTNDGLLYYSSNADNDPGPDEDLVTFTEIDRQGLPGGLPVRSITGISASSTNPKQIYVTLSGLQGNHVYVCYDITGKISGGQPVWQNITGSLPDIATNCICCFPRNNGQELAVGTDIGVFYTVDTGATWHNITAPNQLPNVQVNKLYYTPGTKLLSAGTYGRGIWQIDMTNPLYTVVSGGGGGGGAPPPPPNVTLAPYLQSYVGSRTKLSANIQVFQGNSTVLNQNIQMTAAGYLKFQLPSIGTYDILISINGFLHRRLVAQVINKDVTLRPSLLNGDINRDNSVTIADLTQARQKLGRFTVGPEDADGDGQVTQNDLDIISKNIPQVGDN